MKILHIAPERDAALVAARVVHGIAQYVTLNWVPTPAAALQSLDGNPDTAAVIIEVQAQSCASFVGEIRGRGLTMAVVVVAGSARLEPALAALNAGADGYVAAGPTLEADLPRTVAAAIERERRRRLTLTEPLIELAIEREVVVQQLARAEEARRQTEQRSAADLAAAAAQLADIESRHSVSMAREAKIGLALQERLFEHESALRKADERRASEAVSFSEQLAKRHAEFTASLAQAAQSREALAGELRVAAAALDEERQARRADAAAAADHLRRREAELHADLAAAAAGRTALEHALAETETAHEQSRQRAEADLAAAEERQSALEDLLAQEADRRTGLDRRLSAAETAHQDAERRHAAELTKAAAGHAELHARYDAALEENAAARAALERQKVEAAAVLERVAQERMVEAAAAAAQLASMEAEMGARLADAAAAHAVVDQQLTDAATRHQQAEERTAAALAAAATREAELLERLAKESDARAALERDLTVARGESARRRNRTLSVVSTYRRRAREHSEWLMAEHTGVLHAKDQEIRQNQVEQETLQRRLTTTHDQLHHLHRIVDEERQAHELARSTSESELHRVSAEYGEIRQSFDQLQSAFQTLEQVAGEHAAERARLGTVVADRESELSTQAERHRVAERAAQDALGALQDRFRQAADAGAFETARLQREVEAARRELEATWTHAEALRGVAEHVPGLRTELERSRNEQRRQFERAPHALCRCSDSGTITDANHSFLSLVGCKRVEDLRNSDFVAAALDSAGDLSWLLERARTTRKTETVETLWKASDGRRLVVRLQALAASTGSIDIVAEDITGVRALEERLRQAQRMEAVGRLASEVAVTCDTMLSDVARGAHDWLAKVGSDDALRGDAERLLTDVTRAASFLRQLGTYGKEQERALEPVSARRVLHDLAPVLKRLVGDQIEVVLPKTAASFDVDVEAERLERVFINVAGYARERMPIGGQVRIDLATKAVGRRFTARYAHVRPGDHVLITVTEVPSAGERRGDSAPAAPSSDKPGVDLGVLGDLVASCGGHLWLDAQPAGNMVIKVHLPKPPAADADNRRGRLSKWLRSTPVAKIFV